MRLRRKEEGFPLLQLPQMESIVNKERPFKPPKMFDPVFYNSVRKRKQKELMQMQYHMANLANPLLAMMAETVRVKGRSATV